MVGNTQRDVRRRIRFVVVGRVQGVGFRAHTQRAATERSLVGFVRNRDDGAVTGEAEGVPADVASFAKWLASGSPWSTVEHVALEELAPRGDEGEFAVVR